MGYHEAQRTIVRHVCAGWPCALRADRRSKSLRAWPHHPPSFSSTSMACRQHRKHESAVIHRAVALTSIVSLGAAPQMH